MSKKHEWVAAAVEEGIRCAFSELDSARHSIGELNKRIEYGSSAHAEDRRLLTQCRRELEEATAKLTRYRAAAEEWEGYKLHVAADAVSAECNDAAALGSDDLVYANELATNLAARSEDEAARAVRRFSTCWYEGEMRTRQAMKEAAELRRSLADLRKLHEVAKETASAVLEARGARRRVVNVDSEITRATLEPAGAAPIPVSRRCPAYGAFQDCTDGAMRCCTRERGHPDDDGEGGHQGQHTNGAPADT